MFYEAMMGLRNGQLSVRENLSNHKLKKSAGYPILFCRIVHFLLTGRKMI